MKIGVIYTLSEFRPISYNPGDDLVRDGQRYLLEQVVDEPIDWVVFNFNRPAEWFSGFRWLKKVKNPKRILPIWSFIPVSRCLMKECDYLINASGPRLGMGRRLHSAFFPAELVLARVLKRHGHPKYINLALGTNFKLAKRTDTFWFDLLNRWFCRRHCGNAAVVTCRGQISADWVKKSGIESEVVLCPSILARRYYNLAVPEKHPYVLLNFHTASNREYLDHGECDQRWMAVLEKVVAYFASRSIPVRFIFHEQMELDLARKYYPVEFESRYVLPKDIPEYLNAYGHASVAITGRIHGAYAAASFGVPSICIAGDTRLNMINQLDLPAFDCRVCEAEELIQSYELLEKERDLHQSSLLKMADRAEQRYLEIIRQVVEQ